MSGKPDSPPQYEMRDVPVRGVGWSVLGLFAGIAVSMGIVAAILSVLPSDAGGKRPVALETAEPPPPRLEVHPSIDRAAIEAGAEGHLKGYAWADPGHTRARIPIARAMALIAARGWPDATRGTAQ